ncbi:MAG: PAS domain S-box protein [Pirellulaceae bacterium]|nr:PAS domain S-box protein [Pirellulaceae bacterium]
MVELNRQALLAAILDTAVDAIIVIDGDGIMQSVNPATQTMFGYEPGEMIGQNVKMLMPSPDRQQHDGYLTKYHKTRDPKIIGIGREVIAQKKDGSQFPVHLAVSESDVGDQKLFTGIVRDITPLKQAEQRLAKVNEELELRIEERTQELQDAQADLLKAEKLATLGQVSGGIAHEIRNPLNVIKSSAYFLLNADSPHPEKVREHLQRIDRQSAMIDDVVTALCDMAGMPHPDLRITDLGKLVLSVANSVSIDPSITLQASIADHLPPVMADRGQLLIVFRNLIRNACDAMPNGGTLAITASRSPTRIIIHVADDGTGIPLEQLARIAEPLYTTKARGMGLGLAISKTIVEKNGGELTVESELGEGTTFSVALPIADESHE